MIPPVVASDRGRAQTVCVPLVHMRGCRTETLDFRHKWNPLESGAAAGESPLHVHAWSHIGILSNAGHE